MPGLDRVVDVGWQSEQPGWEGRLPVPSSNLLALIAAGRSCPPPSRGRASLGQAAVIAIPVFPGWWDAYCVWQLQTGIPSPPTRA